MKNLITALCVEFDNKYDTQVSASLNDDFDFGFHQHIGNIAEEMVAQWPIKTELIQGLFNESGLSASHYNQEQISFGYAFIKISDECNASHKEVRSFTRSLRSMEIQRHLKEVNYWLATRRVWELADFGNVEKHRLKQTVITEPYNFQIQTSAKVNMTPAGECQLIDGTISLHYTYGKLNIRFFSDADIHLRNPDEVLDKLIEEFGICHFTTGF